MILLPTMREWTLENLFACTGLQKLCDNPIGTATSQSGPVIRRSRFNRCVKCLVAETIFPSPPASLRSSRGRPVFLHAHLRAAFGTVLGLTDWLSDACESARMLRWGPINLVDACPTGTLGWVPVYLAEAYVDVSERAEPDFVDLVLLRRCNSASVWSAEYLSRRISPYGTELPCCSAACSLKSLRLGLSCLSVSWSYGVGVNRSLTHCRSLS